MKDILNNGGRGGRGRGHELKCLRRQKDEIHDNGTTKARATSFVHAALLCRTPKRQQDKGKSKRSNRHGLCFETDWRPFLAPPSLASNYVTLLWPSLLGSIANTGN